MQGDDRIEEALDRNAQAVTLRPGIAKGTAKTRAVLKPGLDCTVTEGPYEFRIAMSEKLGGLGGAPQTLECSDEERSPPVWPSAAASGRPASASRASRSKWRCRPITTSAGSWGWDDRRY